MYLAVGILEIAAALNLVEAIQSLNVRAASSRQGLYNARIVRTAYLGGTANTDTQNWLGLSHAYGEDVLILRKLNLTVVVMIALTTQKAFVTWLITQ